MTIFLSHTTALEALRMLGAVPADGAREGHTRAEIDGTPDGAAVLRAWLKAFGTAPELPLHVQVPRGSRRVRSRELVTHPMGEAPAMPTLRVSEEILCPTPAALCVQMAPRLTRLELLVLMQELMGTYAVRPDIARGMAMRKEPLLDPGELQDLLANDPSARGARKARWGLERAIPGAASPRESKLAIRLSLPPALGGYGLAVMGLNLEVRVTGVASKRGRARRPDVLLANPELGEGGPLVALEYNGSDHLEDDRRAQDLRRSNELVSAGLSEYVLDKDLYGNLAYMDGLVELVRRDLGLPRQRLSAAQRELRRSRRAELLGELEAIDGVAWGGLARERSRREECPSRVGEGSTPDDDVVPLEAYGV